MKLARIIAVLSVCLVCAAAGALLFAHHSQAGFDLDKSVTVEGRLTKVLWSNPHSLLYMEGKLTGESEVKNWTLEAPSPNALERSGWTRDSLKIGDQVTVSGSPNREGRQFLLIKEITTASGQKFSVGGAGNVDRGGQRTEGRPGQ